MIHPNFSFNEFKQIPIFGILCLLIKHHVFNYLDFLHHLKSVLIQFWY